MPRLRCAQVLARTGRSDGWACSARRRSEHSLLRRSSLGDTVSQSPNLLAGAPDDRSRASSVWSFARALRSPGSRRQPESRSGPLPRLLRLRKLDWVRGFRPDDEMFAEDRRTARSPHRWCQWSRQVTRPPPYGALIRIRKAVIVCNRRLIVSMSAYPYQVNVSDCTMVAEYRSCQEDQRQ